MLYFPYNQKHTSLETFFPSECNPPGSLPGIPAWEAGALPRSLKATASVARAPLLRSGEWGLHTALTGIHPLHESSAVQPNEAHWWGAFLLSLWLMPARARSSGRNAHIRSSTLVYVSKSNYRKKLSETCTHPEVRFFFVPQKYSIIHPHCFLKLCSCLAWKSNSLTV